MWIWEIDCVVLMPEKIQYALWYWTMVQQNLHSKEWDRHIVMLLGEIDRWYWWTPAHGRAKVGRAKVGRPARTYIHQLSADTGCSLKDLPGAMDNRARWRESAREIRASSMTCCCWWYIKDLPWIMLTHWTSFLCLKSLPFLFCLPSLRRWQGCKFSISLFLSFSFSLSLSLSHTHTHIHTHIHTHTSIIYF